ncbi:hypothetical protein THAOC_21397, partial [Thalassiosira oceanica]
MGATCTPAGPPRATRSGLPRTPDPDPGGIHVPAPRHLVHRAGLVPERHLAAPVGGRVEHERDDRRVEPRRVDVAVVRAAVHARAVDVPAVRDA